MLKVLCAITALTLCFRPASAADAEPPHRKIVVTLFAMTNDAWLKFNEDEHVPFSPWVRLDTEAKAGRVQRLVQAELELVGERPAEWRKGTERAFVTDWKNLDGPQGKLKPGETIKRFIGTVIKATWDYDPEADPGPLQVALQLSHDVAAPVMNKINYGTMAVGAERDKLSVEYPQFDKIEWQGRLTMTWTGQPTETRLAASFLHAAAESAEAGPLMRYLIFVQQVSHSSK